MLIGVIIAAILVAAVVLLVTGNCTAFLYMFCIGCQKEILETYKDVLNNH